MKLNYDLYIGSNPNPKDTNNIVVKGQLEGGRLVNVESMKLGDRELVSGGSKSKTIIFEDEGVVKIDVNALLYKALKPLLLNAKEEDIVDSKLAIYTTESLPDFTIKEGTVYYPWNYVSGNPGGTLVTYADGKENAIDIDGGNLLQTYSPTSDVFTDAQLDVLYKLQVQATELDAAPETIDPNFVTGLNNGGICYDFLVVSNDLNTNNEAYAYDFIVEEVEGYDNCVKILDVIKSEDTVPVDGVLQLSLEDAKKLIGIWGEYSRNSDE